MYRAGRVQGGKSEANDRIAVSLLQEAASQNFASAQFNLGVMYSEGHGVGGKSEANHRIAVSFFRKAAEQNHAFAQSNLGGMYGAGRGVQYHPLEAIYWVLKSKDSKGKGLLQVFLSKNPYASLVGDPLGKGISTLLEKDENIINIHRVMMPQELEQMSKPIVARAQDYNPLLESLKTAKPGFMVTGVELTYLAQPWLIEQITPFFSLDELEGGSYLTLGEENVRTVKRLMPFLKQLDGTSKALEEVRLFKKGVDAVFTQSPFQELSADLKWYPVLNQLEKEGTQLVAVEPHIKSLIRAAGSRNRELLEEYPVLQ